MNTKANRVSSWFIATASVCMVAAALFLAGCSSGAPADAAAKYNDSYVDEPRVAQWIYDYRVNYGLTDDEAFAESLQTQGATVASFRQYAIDQLITQDLIEARAKELGLEATDEEIEERLVSIKGSIDDGEGSLWQDTLDSLGLTEDILRARYRMNILQDKVCENDVERRDATDAETLSYVENHLAGTNQLHVLHIVFEGDDAKGRADACYEELLTLEKQGSLDAASFASRAKKVSDNDDARSSGAVLGWTTSSDFADEHFSYLEDEGEGYLSSVISIGDDERFEIIYVDDQYTFPEADEEIESLDDLKAPNTLMESIEGYVGDEVWKSDCAAYLSGLLANAKITYYPVPDDAEYNVSIS